MKFECLYELTDVGLKAFINIMQNGADENILDISNKLYAVPIRDTRAFVVRPFATAKEMAFEICGSFGGLKPQDFAGRQGLWCWLYFVLLDVLSPMKKDGKRKILEYVRWFPAQPNDYQKAQRHLVRMPVVLYSSLGNNADHLLCGKPHTGSDIREQLTSQQDMFSEGFQRACKILYFDEAKSALKLGHASKDRGGTARRMPIVRQQLDVTWDMTDLSGEKILQLLPREFDQFRL
jgi:hypothetical protein